MTARDELQTAAWRAASDTFVSGTRRDDMQQAILRMFADWTPPGEKPPLPGFATHRFALQALLAGQWTYVVDPATLEPMTYATWDEAEEARSIWNQDGSRVVKAPA